MTRLSTASHEDFCVAMDRAFPEQPIPARFFWPACGTSLDQDIPQELGRRIAPRAWKDLTLADWRMIGVSPAVARLYIEPETFLYYLPSLLVHAFSDVGYIDFALESMLPNNQDHRPRGKWWAEFAACVAAPQHAVLSLFLSRVRIALWDQIGSANQELVRAAESIWPDAGPTSPFAISSRDGK